MSCECEQCKNFEIYLPALSDFKTLARQIEEKANKGMKDDLTVFNHNIKLTNIAEKALCERMYDLSKDLFCKRFNIKRLEYNAIEKKR